MVTKEEVLQSIKELSEQGLIGKEDVLRVFDDGKSLSEPPKKVAKDGKLGIADILYYIGGAIVFFGVAIFVTQNWNSLNTATRIISTLGSAVAAYLTAIFLSTRKKTEDAGLAFHLIAALLMPIGLYITFHEAGFNVVGNGMQSLISAILFAVYLSSFFIQRKTIFIFFSIIFGTWLFFSFTSYMVDSNPIWNSDFLYYRVLVAGLTYMILGYYFSQGDKKSLSGFLYGFGIFGFLGAALALGGWQPEQKIFWEIVFPGIVFVALFLSIYLKSNSFLTFGTIYLMAYIIKITAEYFSGSLGWPLSLVLIGLLLIASGYLFIYIRGKYMLKSI
jgi:hypothetical protein